MRKNNLLENALAYALKKGANHCEVFAVDSAGERYVLDNKGLSDCQCSESQGFSVRLQKNGVLGFSYGAAVEKLVLEKAIDDALVSCEFLEPEPYYTFTQGGLQYPSVPWETQDEVGFKVKEEFLYAMKDQAIKGKNIKKIDRASLGSATVTTTLKNSCGLDLSFSANYVSGSVVAVAQSGAETETGSDSMAKRIFSQLNPQTIGENAAFNANNKLNAITLETGEYPVILDSDAVMDFLGIILPNFLGDNIRKGQSKLVGKLGKVITNSSLSLYDDALLKDGISSNSFDDQGVPCRKNVLIENGMVKSFLYDTVSAAKANTASTGNGFAGSTKSLPTAGFTNYYVGAGQYSLKSMLKGIKRGIYIRDLMGLHMANSVSGDFSLGVSGNLIENGALTRSIRGNMVAGNIFDLLAAVEAVGSEVKFYGYGGAPSLKIESMKISGKT